MFYLKRYNKRFLKLGFFYVTGIMDIDVEEDLDFVEDKIKTFLLHKLQEIEVYNAKTKDMLDAKRRSYNDFTNNQSSEKNNSILHISSAWKKIYNNKYVIGFALKNEGSRFCDKLTVLLNWNSSTPLNYKTLLYDNISSSSTCSGCRCTRVFNLETSTTVKLTGYLLIVLEVPQFIEQTNYEIKGSIILHCGDQETNICIPTIEVASSDATNRAVYEAEGKMEDIFSIISSYEVTELLLILPNERTANLNSTFEIHCSLTKLETPDVCKNYFISTRVSTLFDGSILEIHFPSKEYTEILFSTVYSRNEDSLLMFLHHMYQNIPGIIIIPLSLQHDYFMYRTKYSMDNSEEIVRRFKESVNKEIKLMEHLLMDQENRTNTEEESILKIKTQLADLEKDTDFLYLHINK